MAPEILKNENGSYTEKVDIWSLGMSIIEMATGKPAWPNPANAIYNICSTETEPPLPETLLDVAHDFLHRCFVRAPEARADTSELMQEYYHLSAEKEPEIFGAVGFGAVVENVVMDDGTNTIPPNLRPTAATSRRAAHPSSRPTAVQARASSTSTTSRSLRTRAARTGCRRSRTRSCRRSARTRRTSSSSRATASASSRPSRSSPPSR